MKCHQHYEKDAVSQCRDCGRALCPECTKKWSFPICDGCNYNRATNDKNQVIKNIILMIFLFSMCLWYVPPETPFVSKLMLGYMVASTPWGWGFLNRITPNIFIFLPVIGWILYFMFKLSISMFIGQFILPYKLFMFIKDYKKAQDIQVQIKNTTT